jgi:hypothetical protein
MVGPPSGRSHDQESAVHSPSPAGKTLAWSSGVQPIHSGVIQEA